MDYEPEYVRNEGEPFVFSVKFLATLIAAAGHASELVAAWVDRKPAADIVHNLVIAFDELEAHSGNLGVSGDMFRTLMSDMAFDLESHKWGHAELVSGMSEDDPNEWIRLTAKPDGS